MAMISHVVYTYVVSDFGNVEALSLTVWYVHHVIYRDQMDSLRNTQVYLGNRPFSIIYGRDWLCSSLGVGNRICEWVVIFSRQIGPDHMISNSDDYHYHS
jgi:hypothetical protein